MIEFIILEKAGLIRRNTNTRVLENESTEYKLDHH